MHHRLRRVASMLTALSILVGLPLAGGAWLSGGVGPEPSVAGEGFSNTRLSSTTTEQTVSPTSPAVDGRPRSPDMGGSVTEWICEVDNDNARCHPTTTTHTHASPAGDAAKPESPNLPEPDDPDPEPVEPLQNQIRRAPELDRLVPLDPTSAEDWRPLIAYYFSPGDVDRAVDVVECESRGLPHAKNPRSTASGLFQHLASMWPPRAADAGHAGADVFDPVANTAVAAWLVYEGGGWRHWKASRDCWG